MLLRAGVDLVRVSKLLGHSDVAITAKVYVHKSATSTGTADEKAAEPAANSLTEVVERKGIEPSTFALRTRRSPS